MIDRTILRKRLVFALLLPALTWLANPAVAQTPPLANSLPPGAIACVEISGMDAILDRLQNSEYLKSILASQQYQELRNSSQYRMAEAGRKILETQLGFDLWTAGQKLLGGQVAVALYPQAGKRQPDVVALVRVADTKALARLREQIDPFLELAQTLIKRSKIGKGVELIEINPQAFVALHENWIAATNNRDLLTKTLALLAGKGEASLAQDTAYQLMAKQMGKEHLVRVYVDAAAIAKATGGRFGLPKKLANPLASLLFGGILEFAVHSPYAGFTLDVKDEEFVLSASLAGNAGSLGDSYSPFFSKFPASGTRPIPQPPKLIGGFTIYRDLPNWYGNREALLQPEVLPGFDKFEAGLSNLLPGRDFEEDVLPLLGKNFTFLAAQQDYDYLDGKPGVQLPGFAIIIELAKPKEGAEIFRLFFQTISSILNIQAGQQGRQPWILETETYKGVKLAFGRYLKKPSGKRLPLVFNFMPASARVDDQFIISSSLGLCRQLIDELKKPVNAKRVNKNLDFKFHFDSLANILEANQDYFKAQRIRQGRGPDEAKQDVASYLKLLRYFRTLDFSTAVSGDAFTVQLKGSWK